MKQEAGECSTKSNHTCSVNHQSKLRVLAMYASATAYIKRCTPESQVYKWRAGFTKWKVRLTATPPVWSNGQWVCRVFMWIKRKVYDAIHNIWKTIWHNAKITYSISESPKLSSATT